MITVLIILIIIGVLVWLVNTYIPMDNKIKNIFNFIAIVFVVLYLLYIFGIIDILNDIDTVKPLINHED